MTTNFSNRKRVEPFVPTHFYYSSINDPQKIFTDIITGEMERKIGEILEKKEKEENEKKNSQGKVINGVYQKKEPDYGWLMDSKLKERKNLSFLEYSHVSDLIEKTTSSEWNVLIDLWGWELDSVTTRNEVIKTFEECVYKIISNRLQLLPSSASVDDVAISMKQLMDKEESEKDYNFETNSMKTSFTTLSVDTLLTSNNESIQLKDDAKKKFYKVMDIV